MLPTFLLMTSESPWKILVVMHHVSMEIMKDTTESFTTLLQQFFLELIDLETNGALQKKHQHNHIDVSSPVHYTIPHLTYHGMVKIPAFINSHTLDVIYTPSYYLLKSYMTEYNKDRSWVMPTSELQYNGCTHTPIKSNIVHLENLMNITINLVKCGHQVLNLLLA